MKNLFTTAALVIATVITVSAKEPVARKVDANNVFTSSNAFGVGMYKVKGTDNVKLMLETKGKLSIKLTDEKGNVLERSFTKTSAAITFNLSEAPAGEYFVEVSNGKETITRQITKSVAVTTSVTF